MGKSDQRTHIHKHTDSVNCVYNIDWNTHIDIHTHTHRQRNTHRQTNQINRERERKREQARDALTVTAVGHKQQQT